MTPIAVFFSVALASSCPDVAVVEATTPYDANRVWIHEPGWFAPLEKPASAKLSEEAYDAQTPLLVLRHEDETRAWPVQAMAYHHVANDYIGDDPFVVTY